MDGAEQNDPQFEALADFVAEFRSWADSGSEVLVRFTPCETVGQLARRLTGADETPMSDLVGDLEAELDEDARQEAIGFEMGKRLARGISIK